LNHAAHHAGISWSEETSEGLITAAAA
jgi:hypothetical protein